MNPLTRDQRERLISLLAQQCHTERERLLLLDGAFGAIPAAKYILDNHPSLDGGPRPGAEALVNYLVLQDCLDGRDAISLVLDQVRSRVGQVDSDWIGSLVSERDRICSPSPLTPGAPISDQIVVYVRREDAPDAYAPAAILANLGEGDQLSVVGRTCLTWFSGTNANLLTAAIRRGAHVVFVVQDTYAEFPASWDDREVGALKTDLNNVQIAYRNVRSACGESARGRCELRYSSASIRHSRVLHRVLKDGGEPMLVRFQYDLSMERGWKPYLSASGPTIEQRLSGLISATEQIARSSMSEEEFEFIGRSGQRNRETALLNAINVNARDERHWSNRRSNRSIRLVPQAATWLMDQRSPPAPLSAQLLVTDRCTTKCLMCTHFGRASNTTLTLEEIRDLLADFRHMGTRSIVVSGGEPLSREDLGAILCFACGIGIRVGLLTNGVFAEGTTSQARHDTLSAIAQACSWVQVSLDSLDDTAYGDIRKGGTFVDVDTFIRGLVNLGFRAIDICLTIQRSNIAELSSDAFFKKLTRIMAGLPNEVNFRFKFAHAAKVHSSQKAAMKASARDAFLVTESELDALRDFLGAKGDIKRTNVAQIVALLETHAARRDIALGRPMQSTLDDLILPRAAPEGQKPAAAPTCKVMEAMTFIDSNGDVYPCCYTFNDNVANWEDRAEFCVGSWREERARTVSFEPGSGGGLDSNPLYRIWTRERYAELRRAPLPVHPEICARCTRHMAQNVLLNKVDVAFSRYLSQGGHLRRLRACLRGIDDPSDDRYDPIWL